MDKDSLLKQNEVKLIILICGDSKTGKKTIVKQIIGERKFTTKSNDKFTSYSFNTDEFLGKSMISVPVEIRILNSEEQETELKSNKEFFNDALGAFVVTSITDNNSFINGEKWKDKIDLMCCLPNRFPLPIILLINKYDEILNNNVNEKDLHYSMDLLHPLHLPSGPGSVSLPVQIVLSFRAYPRIPGSLTRNDTTRKKHYKPPAF